MVYTVCSQTSGTGVWFWALAPNCCNYCAKGDSPDNWSHGWHGDLWKKAAGNASSEKPNKQKWFYLVQFQGRKSGAGEVLYPSSPLPSHGEWGGSGTYTIIVNWQKKNNRFLARGGEIRQRAWGSPEGRHGSLYSSHKSFPFGPNEDLAGGRGTAGSAMSSHSLASMFSVLWGKGVL